MLEIHEQSENIEAKIFCKDFFDAEPKKRFIFGINEFAESIANITEIGGFIDDFTEDIKYLGKSISKLENVPKGSLIINVVVIERPFTAEKRINQCDFRSLDYFSFYKYSGLDLGPIIFWSGFIDNFNKNKKEFEWTYSLLRDDQSKSEFSKIINFKLSSNLEYLRGFSDIQGRQYFEDFLNLKKEGESFVDVGCYDGFTSLEFIKRCPEYKSVHIFEPEKENFNVVKSKLAGFSGINYNQFGLSNKKQTLSFKKGGSASKISVNGNTKIAVDRLDSLINQPVTFIKMDIEGAESDAIEGASQTIKDYHPKLAICVYHKIDDLYTIPQQIFKIRDDYDLYLRHYTEGIVETVMFFIPQSN